MTLQKTPWSKTLCCTVTYTLGSQYVPTSWVVIQYDKPPNLPFCSLITSTHALTSMLATIHKKYALPPAFE